MELILSTDAFKIKGVTYDRFPILLNNDMSSCRPANEFMRWYLRRGAIASKRSWQSTGRALYDYFSFLEAHELSWRNVDGKDSRDLLAAYRDYSLETIGLARSTVAQRLTYVAAFYEYWLRNGWISELPFSYEARRVRRNGGFLHHLNDSSARVKTRDVMPKIIRAHIKFLDRDQANALLSAAQNIHHKMLIRFALQTGLRRDEIASFPAAYIQQAANNIKAEHYVPIRLNPRDGTGMRTKGAKERTVFVPRSLVRDLQYYCKQNRGERAHLTENLNSELFLNQRGEPFAANGKGIERIVRDIGKRAGLDVHPHMLRHTYATHTLFERQRRKKSGVNALVFVQKQLGHESIQTTMAYLHLVNELADDAVLQYDAELNGEAPNAE